LRPTVMKSRSNALGSSALCRQVQAALKCEWTLWSPGDPIKTSIAHPTPEFLIHLTWGGPQKWHF
jgi:hypothetical protein